MSKNLDDSLAGIHGSIRQMVDWGVITITGKDAFDFLHRLSTRDFRTQGAPVRLGAFLTGKAQLISAGFFETIAEGVHFILPKALIEDSLAHLNAYHFAESVEFVSDPKQSVWISSSANFSKLQALSEAHWTESTLPDLTWMRTTNSTALAALADKLPKLHTDALHGYMIARESPLLDIPSLKHTLVLEANLAATIDREKGCYPGQEVVERIFTYGQVNRKLMAVRLGTHPTSLPCALRHENEAAGSLISCTSDADQALGLAFIHKKFWDKIHFKGDPDLIATVL